VALAAAALFAAAPSMATAAAPPVNAQVQAPLAAAGGHAPSRAQVLETQHLLIGLGYPLGSSKLGGLGPRTRGAIEYFQRKYRLAVTGRPDPRTIAAMKGVLASLRGVPGKPQAQPEDLVEEAIGSRVPILTIAVLLALVLALLALSSRSEARQDSATAEEMDPATSGES
jgi:peptidoglycan hydrolase-like protein with peptidoglycan-binding domain